MKVIDRNDELSILYEKKNLLDNILKKGERQIVEKEEEIRRANIRLGFVNDIKR